MSEMTPKHEPMCSRKQPTASRRPRRRRSRLVGYIERDTHRLADACLDRRARTNAHLVVATSGGYPHFAYAVARHLRGRYARLTVQVPAPVRRRRRPRRARSAQAGPVRARHPRAARGARARTGRARCAERPDPPRGGRTRGTGARPARDVPGRPLGRAATEVLARLAAGVLAPLAGQVDMRAIGEAAASAPPSSTTGGCCSSAARNVRPAALERLLSGLSVTGLPHRPRGGEDCSPTCVRPPCSRVPSPRRSAGAGTVRSPSSRPSARPAPGATAVHREGCAR